MPSSDILVLMDGDGSDIITDLERLVAPVAAGEADFVIASRMRGHREPGSMLFSQVFAGHLVGLLLRLTQRVHYTDMGPFRAIRRSSLQQLGMSEMTYGWNLEMQIRAAQCGLRIVEIPVDYRCRIGGVSKVSGNFSASFRTGLRILAVLARAMLSPLSNARHNTPKLRENYGNTSKARAGHRRRRAYRIAHCGPAAA